MGINFRYVDYKESLVSSLKKSGDSSVVLVFSDYLLKRAYSERQKSYLFQKQEEIFTREEFFEKGFITEKGVLKESKRFLTLYSSLSEKIKEQLKITGYYQFITLADEFFKFYKEKNNQLKDSYSDLEIWQEKKIEKFELIKREYDKYLEKMQYIPLEWVKSEENMNLEYFNQFKKIVIVDIIDWTPLEISMIKKLGKEISVEIVLQCKKGDFNEELFFMEKISFPKKEEINLEIIEVSEELEEGVNMLNMFTGEHGNDIYTPNLDKTSLGKIFPKQFLNSALPVLDDTNFYKFLKGLYEILATVEPRMNSAISLATLEKYINEEGFKINYGIEGEDLKDFYRILGEDFKYFSDKLVDEEVYERFKDKKITGILLKIYLDVKKISKFKTVQEFLDFFKKETEMENLLGKNYIDIVEKIYESWGLAKTSEELYGDLGFKKVFSENISLGVFNLILKYMNSIEIKTLRPEEFKPQGVIKELSLAKERRGRDSYFINITSDTLPGNIGNGSFFTEEQKRKNGVLTTENQRLNLKYRFFQGVFTSGKSTVFFRKNEKKATKISPFLEELILNYNLKIKKPEIEMETSLTLIKNSLNSEIEYTGDFTKDISKDILKKENGDFENGEIKLGAYSFGNLKNCYFRFFFQDIERISPVSESFERNITGKFLGTFVHIALENIAREMWKKIIDGNFELEEGLVKKNLTRELIKNRYKIPMHLDMFLEEILLKSVERNIKKFYSNLEEVLEGKKVKRFDPEKSSVDRSPIIDKDLKIYLRGRVDLLIETEKNGVPENFIIDYKTGGMKEEQLDFYSVMLYGDSDKSTKGVFNVMKDSMEWAKKVKISGEELRDVLEDFLISNYYTLAKKSSDCLYCSYENICRKELKNV